MSIITIIFLIIVGLIGFGFLLDYNAKKKGYSYDMENPKDSYKKDHLNQHNNPSNYPPPS